MDKRTCAAGTGGAAPGTSGTPPLMALVVAWARLPEDWLLLATSGRVVQTLRSVEHAGQTWAEQALLLAAPGALRSGMPINEPSRLAPPT